MNKTCALFGNKGYRWNKACKISQIFKGKRGPNTVNKRRFIARTTVNRLSETQMNCQVVFPPWTTFVITDHAPNCGTANAW